MRNLAATSPREGGVSVSAPSAGRGRCSAAAAVQVAELLGLLGVGLKETNREMSDTRGQAFSRFSV